ncbi:MAG: formylglycine-generating enzyme family protein [Cyanobacteria bacterium P01_B01_bin.77]
MFGSRHRVINQLEDESMTYLLKHGVRQNRALWNSLSPNRPCSRRQALKFLGFSTASAMVTLGCRGTAADLMAPTGSPLRTSRVKTIQVDAAGQITSEKSITANYFDEPSLRSRLSKILPLRMVNIPAGEFVMGSPPTEAQREEKEGPQRTIQVPRFYMGAFVITQRQYEAVMGNNPSYFTDDEGKDGANLPIEQITWNEADTFCKELSQLTGRTYRLPSEAEWEYACRAGTTTPFYFGEKLTTDIANFFADFSFTENFEENYRNTPVAADSFWPNAFGLYNMHGNAYEWCADDYHDSYKEAPTDAQPWVSGNATASKVMRGGSWFNDTPFCRSASRDKNSQTGRSNSCSFRVVCEPSS